MASKSQYDIYLTCGVYDISSAQMQKGYDIYSLYKIIYCICMHSTWINHFKPENLILLTNII